jgi:hypothetical protein
MCQSKAHLHAQTSKLNASRLPHPSLPSKPKVVVLGGALLATTNGASGKATFKVGGVNALPKNQNFFIKQCRTVSQQCSSAPPCLRSSFVTEWRCGGFG